MAVHGKVNREKLPRGRREGEEGDREGGTPRLCLSCMELTLLLWVAALIRPTQNTFWRLLVNDRDRGVVTKSTKRLVSHDACIRGCLATSWPSLMLQSHCYYG